MNARAVVDVNSEVVTGRDVSGFSVVVSCPAVVTNEDGGRVVDSVEGAGDVEVVLVDEVEKLVSPSRIGVVEVDEM